MNSIYELLAGNKTIAMLNKLKPTAADAKAFIKSEKEKLTQQITKIDKQLHDLQHPELSTTTNAV